MYNYVYTTAYIYVTLQFMYFHKALSLAFCTGLVSALPHVTPPSPMRETTRRAIVGCMQWSDLPFVIN